MAIDAKAVLDRTKTKDPEEIVQEDVDTAKILLDAYIEDEDLLIQEIPGDLYDRAHLAVALELYNQRKSPNGQPNQQYAAGDGGTVYVQARVNRDPLTPAYPLLRDFVPAVRFA